MRWNRSFPALGPDVRAASDVELEVDHVAVADDVVLAFQVQLGVGAAGGRGAEADEIFPPDDLGLDEAAREVGVDGAGGLGPCCRA